MPCYRIECENIMCSVYVDNGVGYICSDCQGEFKVDLNKRFGTQVLKGTHMHEELVKFMASPKLSFSGSDEWVDIDDLFNQ